MKLSEKRRDALYNAIHENIRQARIAIERSMSSCNNSDEAAKVPDAILWNLDQRIHASVLKVLGVNE